MEQIHLTTGNWIVLGCTIFNICYIILLIFFEVYQSRKRMVCVKCKRDGSKSFACKRCKNYKYSLAYYATKHPEKLKQIGITDNYKNKRK